MGSGRRGGDRERQGKAGSRQARGWEEGAPRAGLPVAWPWSPSHVRWFGVSSLVRAAQGKQKGVRGRGGPRQRLLSISPLSCHTRARPWPSRERSAHHRTLLPAFPLGGTWFGAFLEPGRGPVSSSCLSPDCKLQWLERIPSPPAQLATHLPTANTVSPMVRFSGWYMCRRSSGSKVPSETMGANQGVRVSSSVGLAAGEAAGAETLPSSKPRSHPSPASHAV